MRQRDIKAIRRVRRSARRAAAPWRWVYRKMTRAGTRWMYPELAGDPPPPLSASAQFWFARNAVSGSVKMHPWLQHQQPLPKMFGSPSDAVRGLEQTRAGLRSVAQWCGLRWCLRKTLRRVVINSFRDQYRRDAINQLLVTVAGQRQSHRLIRQEVLRWMNDGPETDHALVAFGQRILDDAESMRRREMETKRLEAQRKIEREERQRQLEEHRRQQEELAQLRAREAAEEAARAAERARLARERAEIEVADRRRRADAAAGSALRKISELGLILQATEHLSRQPLQAYRRRVRESFDELRGLHGALQHEVDELTLQDLNRRITRPFHPGISHRCGTLARRVIIRVRDCGEFRDLAIIEMLRLMEVSTKDNGLYSKLWCSINNSRIVRLVYEEAGRPWCTVFAELEFHRSSVPEHLNIIVSIHVPFGEGADRSPYPTEESTARVRPTQTLSLVPKLIVSAGHSAQNQDEEVNEQSESARTTRSRSDRTSVTNRESFEYRTGSSYSESYRESDTETVSSPFSLERRKSKEEAEDARREHGTTQQRAWDNSRSTEFDSGSSNESETGLRKRQSAMNQTQREVRVEFTPTAVGVDYSDPNRLLQAWRHNPAHTDASAIFDLLCHDLPGLAEALPDAVFERRRHERSSDAADRAGSNNAAFWKEVGKWALIERPGLTPEKVVIQQDGTARPIDSAMVRSLVQGMRPELQGLTDQVFALPPGQRDDHEW